jgi:hypothetical protein
MTVGPDVPDYSRPSVDVDRRTDADWQWGVTHTVRPERLAPMLPDVEYSITVKVQRQLTGLDRETSFAGLYARAITIAGARCQDFGRQDQGVHHWVMCHAWRTVPAGSSSIALAIVMMGLMRPTSGEMPPTGKPAPTRQELMTNGGATMEEMQHRSPQRATEVFVEFDHRPPAVGGGRSSCIHMASGWQWIPSIALNPSCSGRRITLARTSSCSTCQARRRYRSQLRTVSGTWPITLSRWNST